VIPQGAVHLYNKARTSDKDVIVYDELMHDLHNESGQRAAVCCCIARLMTPSALESIGNHSCARKKKRGRVSGDSNPVQPAKLSHSACGILFREDSASAAIRSPDGSAVAPNAQLQIVKESRMQNV
jgi:hypothetical protein